ncbi:4cc22c61-bf1b-4482-8892-2926799c2547 [Thermothielavioides terrestris]|uniref:4cc22c61-bf1b-4482-8892-2926799c2547 n=1 Tax=Thermothielavioides terrestris TaxID=2587410 RepID=A0A446BIY5_9PEZI|nr:4cc22c61-bf1b-4482-8892-2926799c2547 [Thermothielavioides terrestris]
MAQAPTAVDPSSERAASFEPCSTRPNPFDDSDLSSRKRRRTSLASGSRSRSVETVNSSPRSPSKGTPALELTSDSAMKIDSDPANPSTPEQQLPDAAPVPPPSSSRVTINVRTPSQPLEPILPSPPSPSPNGSALRPAAAVDAVRSSVEGPEAAMSANDATIDALASSRSSSTSPPVEVVSMDGEDDVDFEDDEPEVTMLDESGRSLGYDPTVSFPFHDASETYLDTVIRLLQYLPTHDQVSRCFAEWIDRYLLFVKTASPRAIDDSYFMHRDMWQPVPQLVLHMVNRKTAYPRSRDMRQEIFAFYRSFAELTAFFVEFDCRVIKSPALSDQGRLQALASPPYVHALGALLRREEVTLHSTQLRNGDEDWSYPAELAAILDRFQKCPAVQGGALTHIIQLALTERQLVSQFPRPVTDHLGNLCLIAGNILKYGFRRMHGPLNEPFRRNISLSYAFFTSLATMLSDIIDKNLNQLSPDGAGNLLEGLTEIYQACLTSSGVVPAEIIDEHFEAHPRVAPHHVPEAMAYHWKFTHFVRLIKSGQMQLRVMAVSTMCNDLVAFYRKNTEPHANEAIAALWQYIANFLLETGLVNYILGPTCHPEITLESSNIIGFLVISDTYTNEHTDALWQTVTSTQDPRVSDALLRMIGRILHLFPQQPLMHFFGKLNAVPVELFGPAMREFCDQLLRQLLNRFPDTLLMDSAPFDLCIRLIRQSSGLGTQSAVAYPDIQQFAVHKFESILTHGPGQEGRWKIYRDCLSDIAQRSPSTIGSLWVLKLATRFHHARDLRELTSEHDLPKLLIDELEGAISAAKAAGFPAVISGPQNTPRKELLMAVIFQESQSLTKGLGSKLWGLLVGSEAACQADRDVAWQILTAAMKRSQGENPFTSACFAEYLPTLEPQFFCQGALDFVREGVMPLVNDPASIALDDDDNPGHPGIELLWRIALTAPTGTVEQRAIQTLVNDIYIESRSIQSFSHYRARKVHLALVGRCLRQLSSAARKLNGFADGAGSQDEDSAVLATKGCQHQDQGLLFTRSLAILREFHRLHQARPQFSAPDMRSLMLEPLKAVEGESAELKYQSFDGDRQTPVMPLNIGKRNTAASLLASLREATGFESYRIFYRGRPFVPQESDICKSLEDLQIHNGIILVKKETDAPASPRIRPGASPVEVEILSHFEELGEYLSMEEEFAREIYGFLVKLPADEKILEAIDAELPASAAQSLDGTLLDHLLSNLSVAASSDTPLGAPKHVSLCLQSILESCSMSGTFMSAFCVHPEVPRVLEDLLLNDERDLVRHNTALLIRQKTCPIKENESVQEIDSTTAQFRDFFWHLVSRLVRPAIARPNNSAEVLDLCFVMLRTLQDAGSEIANAKQLSDDWFNLLLNYTTTEDPTKPANVDLVAAGLVRLLHALVCLGNEDISQDVLPASGVARKLFWKHLFPPRNETTGEYEPSHPIACDETRRWLKEIICTVVKGDRAQLMWALEDNGDLVPVYPEEEDFYSYELPQQFERTKAIRAPCGYPGLRNLSNTCYFNSLLTQLFMNVDFRQFMLTAAVRDAHYSQNLLFETQKLFAYLQESVRHFINPEDCVAAIKTYEDTQIDIAIQMDVDEFYNLLFDRWEGQFLTSEEKNRFRSFYGGQLVQQVRSQECEHVSERLEPFSAIQCDIKGKSSLQESLQAYVDGEIMEGDNKYKCSTCDRHVDAVKRACLKDIPDNLIFHLKRFDFNLRTMQRSKINDYFAFPDMIDMRPYTIDHLSNPEEEQSQDLFELVGILVHTGTAESGHYYSYIRERPTSGDAQTWVEFNDETVGPWDPASMANACFGGPDYQPQFPNNAMYEKQYSAYMLFYQRASTLAGHQARLRGSEPPGPPRAKMPEDLLKHIWAENAWFIRRHCLFDPSQIQFICLLLFELRNLNSGRCSEDHAMETQALTMALSHLDQVASRTKDVPEFYNLLSQIQAFCENCAHCGLAVFSYFSRYTVALRMLLQRNLDEDVRQGTAYLLIQVLRSLKAQVPEQYGIPSQEGDDEDMDQLDPQMSVISGMIRMLEQLWQHFHTSLRSWPEVFDFMLSFVKLGRHELAAFLGHPDFLRWLLWIVLADANTEALLPNQFAKLASVISRRMPNRPPSYESIIQLLDFLLAHMRCGYTPSGQPTGVTDSTKRLDPDGGLDQPFALTKAEADLLHQMGPRTFPVNIFIDRLISIGQNPAASDSIIASLMKQSRRMENSVFRTLLHRITGQIAHNVGPYLHVASAVFCRVASDAGLISDLIKHVSQQCLILQNSEGKAFLDFMRETFDAPRERSGETRHQVIMAGLDSVPDWAPGLLGYFDTSVIDETERFLRDKIFQPRISQSPSGNESEEDREKAEKVRQTARALGTRCLWYLRDNYVARNTEVTERSVGGLQRVIKQCSKYFNLKEPIEDDEARDFLQLSQNVMESMANLMVVDELEEDGSGVYYSDDSSIASSNTAG